MNFKQNLRNGFSKKSLLNDAMALVSAFLYTLPASFFKLNGGWGLLLAFGGAWFAGKLFGLQAICNGAVAIAATHLIYVYGDDMVKQMNNQGIWALDENSLAMNGLADDYGLPYGAATRTLPTGDTVAFFPGSQVDDYIMPNQALLNDYIGQDTVALPLYPSDRYVIERV